MMNIVNTIEFMVKDINKYLDDITLNAITVDGKTILKLEDMSNKNISPRLEKILRKLIKLKLNIYITLISVSSSLLKTPRVSNIFQLKVKTLVATETCIRGERECVTQKNSGQKTSPTGKRIYNI